MLLAVEGGGFFSSSASGYSKGLTLLLLGQRSQEKQMRVSPWNQYKLVEEERKTVVQLASRKNKFRRGCASFICFGRASAGIDGQSAFKIGPTKPVNKTKAAGATVEAGKEVLRNVGNEDNLRDISLKSSLKKRSQSTPLSVKNNDEHDPLDEQQHNDTSGVVDRRKVQWTDACGRELAEIREFEISEAGGSDDELEHGNGKTCSCRIM